MTSLIHRFHIRVGTIIAIPLLAWSTSGLFYALPGAVEGGSIAPISAATVKIGPADAMARANAAAGRSLPLTALTLLTRDGRPTYQAVGGMGADSLLIDAETGEVKMAPPPGLLTRYFRQAHFYYFAGRWQVLLLIIMSALAAFSALSGIYLSMNHWLRSRGPIVRNTP